MLFPQRERHSFNDDFYIFLLLLSLTHRNHKQCRAVELGEGWSEEGCSLQSPLNSFQIYVRYKQQCFRIWTQNCISISICNHMPRRKIRHLQFCCNARQSRPTASLCRRLTARFAPKSFLDQNSSTARFTPFYVDSLYLKYTMQSCLKVGCLKLSKMCNFWPKMFSKDTHTGRLNHSNPIPPCRFGEHHQQPRK